MAKRSTKSAGGGESRAGAPSGPGPRIVVAHGPDVFLAAEKTREVRTELEASLGADGVQMFGFDGASAAPADVLDECRSFDLLQRHKLVIVDNGEKFLAAGDNREIMERYAASPSPNATLVLRCGKWNKGKIDALIERVGRIERCEPPSAAEAQAWALARAPGMGANLTRDGARALVERVGPDLGRIETEIAKLACAAGEGAPIGPELVHDLTGRSGEDEVWAIQSPLLSGRPEAGLSAVRDALTIWRQSAVGVLYAEIDLVRKAHALARLTGQGDNPFSAGKRARVWKDADRFLAIARQAGSERLADLFAEAVETDARTKGWGAADAERSAWTLGARIAMLGAGGSR